jgi:hypothetical protein
VCWSEVLTSWKGLPRDSDLKEAHQQHQQAKAPPGKESEWKYKKLKRKEN